MQNFEKLYNRVMFEEILTEKKWAKKAAKTVKKGKMHEVLGIKDGETISSKYKSGESLGTALSRKVGKEKAIKMLNFAGNIGGGNRLFKAAVNHLKESASLISESSTMAEWEFILNKSEAGTTDVVRKIRAIAMQLREQAKIEFKAEEEKYDAMKYAEETEFLKTGGKQPLEKYIELEIENEIDTITVVLRSEDIEATNNLIKDIYEEANNCGLVEYFGDDKPEWFEEKQQIAETPVAPMEKPTATDVPLNTPPDIQSTELGSIKPIIPMQSRF